MESAISQRLDALTAQVDELRRENRELWVRLEPSAAQSSQANADNPGQSVSRRGLLAAAAGTAAGIVVGQARPASAVDGAPVLLGQTNNASRDTSIVTTSGSSTSIVTTRDVGLLARGPLAISGLSDTPSGAGVNGEGAWGVNGFSTATAGRGVNGLAFRSAGVNYGVYGRSTSPTGEGVFGHADHPYGRNFGVHGRARGDSGVGVFGEADGSVGQTIGVHGQSSSSEGTGVVGVADQTSGTTFGVRGFAFSPSGYAVHADGRFKCTYTAFLATPNHPPEDADLVNGVIPMASFYLDEKRSRLSVRVRYSTGVLKTGSINLS